MALYITKRTHVVRKMCLKYSDMFVVGSKILENNDIVIGKLCIFIVRRYGALLWQ